MATMNTEPSKPVHTLIIDAGPIIRNDPPASSLLAHAHRLITIPAVTAEIRDPAARSRFELSLKPFLEIRTPRPESVKVVADFARRTGDLAVLSRPDVQLLALAYEVECERNGGDWRLRRVPGQKRVNGARPERAEVESEEKEGGMGEVVEEGGVVAVEGGVDGGEGQEKDSLEGGVSLKSAEDVVEQDVSAKMENVTLSETSVEKSGLQEHQVASAPAATSEDSLDASDSGSDSEGWITPSNLKKQQAKDADTSITPNDEPKTMQVATISGDFAMQNVLLQMNLNLLSSSMQRVRHLKTYILRCHACFEKVKDMTKQFCPRCGKPTLTRVACSTNQNGEFKLHLKKNMQWNTRGDRYSIPKAVSGSSSGKLNIGGGGKGGGKGGWGQSLILAEDQKEYIRAMSESSRTRERNLMDEDYLPAILTGERSRQGAKPRIGAGKTVNSRRR